MFNRTLCPFPEFLRHGILAFSCFEETRLRALRLLETNPEMRQRELAEYENLKREIELLKSEAGGLPIPESEGASINT